MLRWAVLVALRRWCHHGIQCTGSAPPLGERPGRPQEFPACNAPRWERSTPPPGGATMDKEIRVTVMLLLGLGLLGLVVGSGSLLALH